MIFLQNCVINRKRKFQKKRDVEEIVGRETVQGYVYAVEWFWTYLVGMEHINETTSSKPNGILVKDLLESVQTGKDF